MKTAIRQKQPLRKVASLTLLGLMVACFANHPSQAQPIAATPTASAPVLKTVDAKKKRSSPRVTTNSLPSPETAASRLSQAKPEAPSVGIHQAIRARAQSVRPSKRVADELSVSATHESYLDQSSPPAGVANYKMIGARLKTHSEGSFLTGYLEFAGSFAADVENYNNIEVPEAFLHLEHGFGKSSTSAEGMTSANTAFDANTLKAQLSVGRKREAWSQVDSDWMLGLWQPLNRFDYLRSTEQGLTGAFVSLERGDIEILAFGSTLFIPEQSQPFQLQDGKFTSSSPWFSEPANRMVLFPEKPNVETDVRYKMEMPTIGSVINHNSAGFLIRAGSLDQGFFGQTSYVHKPRNTVSLPFEAKLDLTSTTQYGAVSVYPQVIYHDLVGADLGYRSRLFAASVSALHEVVQQEAVPDNLNHQTLDPMTLLSPKVEFRLFPSRFWGPRLSISYLQTFGGDTAISGPLETSKDVFGPRTIFRQAVSAAYETMLVRAGRFRLNHGLRWIEELAESGTVLMTDVRMHFSDEWRLTFAADILGSRQPLDQNQTFIARYRGNDRITGQLTYSF